MMILAVRSAASKRNNSTRSIESPRLLLVEPSVGEEIDRLIMQTPVAAAAAGEHEGKKNKTAVLHSEALILYLTH